MPSILGILISHKHNIIGFIFKFFQSFFTISGFIYFITFKGKNFGKGFTNCFFIVDDQNIGH